MFCDAAFQAQGLIILGEALTTDEELTSEDAWHWHDFSAPGEHPWQDYTLGAEHIGHIDLAQLNTNLSFVIGTVQDKLRELIAKYPQRIVAGTVRLAMALATAETNEGTQTRMNMWLVWERYIKED